MLQLICARLVIEPSVAAQSAVARQPRDLERLEAAVTNALVPPAGPALNFHVELAAASGNPLLQEVLASLRPRTADPRVVQQGASATTRNTRRSFEAVRAQNAAQAGRLTRKHLDNIGQATESAPDFT